MREKIKVTNIKTGKSKYIFGKKEAKLYVNHIDKDYIINKKLKKQKNE